MGFRFQKRIKLMPGITLNLSRKGVSTSLGTTGARVTLGHGQQRITTGIPGSGISHTSIKSKKRRQTEHPVYLTASPIVKKPFPRWVLIAIFCIFGSAYLVIRSI